MRRNPGASSRAQAVIAMATPADMSNFAERTKIDAALAALISPVTHVSKDSAPFLLMHGTQDRTVPIAQSELLLARYQKAGTSADFLKVEGAPHASSNGEWFDDTLKNWERSLESTLVIFKLASLPRTRFDRTCDRQTS